jgi:putative transposase
MNSPRSPYRGYRFPPEIISYCVWLYFRFSVSYRDIEELMSERGVTVTYETIRAWCYKFGQDYAKRIRARRGQLGDTCQSEHSTCCYAATSTTTAWAGPP